MIEDTEQCVEIFVGVGLAGEVDAPDEVARNSFWFGVLEVAAQNLDFVIVLLQGLVNVGFSDGDFAGDGKTAVAEVGDAAASRFWHKRFEANDFVLKPFGFLRAIAMVVFAGWLNTLAAIVRTMRCMYPTHDALEVRVQEFKKCQQD